MPVKKLFDVIITDDMQEVSVQLPQEKSRGYTIYVDKLAIGKLGELFKLEKYSRIMVVTDEAVKSEFLQTLLAALPEGAASVSLPSGEKVKNIQSVQQVWTALHDAGCDRKSLVINLGGGVISDIGGFAASTYMRGIDFINIPTTILSQVDASVGGKTGFNFAGIKNLVGSFQQPVGIVIDTQTLSTLPQAELISGFGEIIKHGLIWDENYFKKVTAKQPLEFSEDELTDIITGSCRIKLAIIQDDIHENAARKLVNFGHSVGHAVEALSLETDRPLLHGEAVSIGMVAEANISVRLDLLPGADLERIKNALERAGLPTSVRGLRLADIREKMRSDKKNNDGKLSFTLLDDIGHALYNKEVPETAVTQALEAILD